MVETSDTEKDYTHVAVASGKQVGKDLDEKRKST